MIKDFIHGLHNPEITTTLEATCKPGDGDDKVYMF